MNIQNDCVGCKFNIEPIHENQLSVIIDNCAVCKRAMIDKYKDKYEDKYTPPVREI